MEVHLRDGAEVLDGECGDGDEVQAVGCEDDMVEGSVEFGCDIGEEVLESHLDVVGRKIDGVSFDVRRAWLQRTLNSIDRIRDSSRTGRSNVDFEALLFSNISISKLSEA